MSRVAVNMCDLDTISPRNAGYSMVGLLLTDFISANPPTVDTAKGMVDGSAIILDGPAGQDQERVDALVTFLQTVLGPKKMRRPVRCYREGPKGGWPMIKPPKSTREVMREEQEENA